MRKHAGTGVVQRAFQLEIEVPHLLVIDIGSGGVESPAVWPEQV